MREREASAVRTRPTRSGRRRAWLALAAAVSLVLTYQVVDFTYLSAHLPPRRYEVLAPGASAAGKVAEYRLLSLRQTQHWGKDYDFDHNTPAPGAVWVVADFEVTIRAEDKYLSCTGLTLVTTDGRSWEEKSLGPSTEAESCSPDAEETVVGATYPFQLGYEVPTEDIGQLAGVALDSNGWRPFQLMRPPA